MSSTAVISLGGSVVAPEWPDGDMIRAVSAMVRSYLTVDERRRLVIVVGGGAPARRYQATARELGVSEAGLLDSIGIRATRLNAELLRAVLNEYSPDPVVEDPSVPPQFSGRVLIGAGWKPGFSTDYDAVLLAEHAGARTLINLSNIPRLFTDDPRQNPQASPIDRITWPEFRRMVGDEWQPGRNVPFDPVASRRAEEAGLRVVIASGRDSGNTLAILEGQAFTGSEIVPADA